MFSREIALCYRWLEEGVECIFRHRSSPLKEYLKTLSGVFFWLILHLVIWAIVCGFPDKFADRLTSCGKMEWTNSKITGSFLFVLIFVICVSWRNRIVGTIMGLLTSWFILDQLFMDSDYWCWLHRPLTANANDIIGYLSYSFGHQNWRHLILNYSVLSSAIMIYVYGFNQSAKSLVGIMISSIILGSVAIEIFTDPQDTHTGFSHIIFGLVGANIIFGIRQFPTNLGWLIISGILFYEKYNLCIGTPDIVRSHISWYGHSAGMIGGMLFAAYKSLKNGRSDYVEIVATPLYLFQSSCPKRQGV